MADILFSPGIQITETDRSFVPARPLIAGAAIIGPTVKGPAYSPTVVTSFAGYQQMFGTTFMMNRYDESGSVISEKSQEYLTSMAARAFFEQGGDSLLVVRVTEGEFKSAKAVVENAGAAELASYIEEQDKALAEYIAEQDKALESGSISQEEHDANVQAKETEYSSSVAEKKEEIGDAANYPAFTINTIAQGEYLNNWEGDFQNRAEDPSAIENVIRGDGSLISGSKDNIRWEIANVDAESGTFSIYVRRGDDLDADKMVLESFSNLTLDPDSENYILRRIGDQHQVLMEDPDDGTPYIDVQGNYPNRSNFIYISDVTPIYGYFQADGYTVREGAAEMLPAELEGGFMNGEGKLFASEEDEKDARFFSDIAAGLAGGTKIQGISPENYDKAIRLLENVDEYNINILSAPGLNLEVAQAQVAMLDSLASKRGDLIAVVDLVGYGANLSDVLTAATSLNSSYSATYWPWLQMLSATGRLEWVPASTLIPGVYTFTDHIAAPWFAPAGMTRGSLDAAVSTERKLLKQHRDKLYKKNVNPISILAGNGITIYGQKTLQKKATALDRVNVRRLMIEIKKSVKNMASGILFEQNSAALRNQFKGNLDNYLESVVQRQGLYGYHTIVDEINTPDVIDRNEFRCQIYVQPTKVIEFIYIDMIITNTGVEFRS